MIDKYYNGVIENLEMIKRYQGNDDSVFLLGMSLDTVN